MSRNPAHPLVSSRRRDPALSRRRFLQVFGGGVVAAPVLAACGTQGTDNAPVASGRTDSMSVSWSNWPQYLDATDDDANSHPTLTAFTEQTGIEVDYTEDINSNDEFFGKITPQLGAGQSIGRDLIVLTNDFAAKMIRLGYVETLDKANIPNESNLDSIYLETPFDPGREYSLPWQSGITGIGYDPEALGREILTLDDLFQDDLKGRITFLTEMTDTMGLIMLSMDIDPAEHAMADFEAAIAKLQKVVDDGYIRQFTGNEYSADLAAGNVGAAMAWSGDVIQLQADNPNMALQIPDDGGMLWSDVFLIPKGAANKANAEKLIDYYYQPDVSAEAAAWVNYVCPVAGAQEAMKNVDEELATDELIFPTEAIRSKLHAFKVLDEETDRAYNEMFQAVIGA